MTALWLALHALLVAAAALVALPLAVKGVVVAAIAAHGWRRRAQSRDGAELVLEADDSVRIVVAGEAPAVPDDVTRVTPHWVLLEWGAPRARRKWLLLADQLEADDWARLSARLRRRRSAATSDLR